jgi:hypothetical protein
MSNKVLGFVVICGLMVGCSTARVVSVQPHHGGVISVAPPQDPDARAKATTLMVDNCGSIGYDITEEGEAVIGSTSSGSMQKSTGMFGQPAIAQNSSSTNKTEWRITYKCKDTASSKL